MTTLGTLRPRFVEERARLLAELREKPSGLAWCEKLTALADWLIADIYLNVVEPGSEDLIAILAVGGFGRKELAPYSDIDILVIPGDEGNPAVDGIVRRIHRDLHDAFSGPGGMALSYAFFLVNDAPALDPKTRTAMLDARFVCGSQEAMDRFETAFRESLPVGEFLLEKVREREAAHARWNDTPLAVEPNLKEGAGGLRSLQCSNWIRQAIGLEKIGEQAAYDEILRLRNLLHLTAGSNLDRFTRSRQAEVTDLTGQDLDTTVSEAARCASVLHGLYCESVEFIRESRYSLGEGVEANQGKIEVRPNATLSGAAQAIAIGSQLGLRVCSERADTTDEVDGPAALYAIGTGEKTLRQLDRCGILGRLLPELERCRTLMPEDAVHAYSVFEHSLRVVANLEAFPKESFYSRLRDGLSTVSPLYFAALLHDVGKAITGRPHSVIGAEIAAQVARRWNLAPRVASTVEWLVREHLTFARFIGMRDVSDPKTAQEFAKLVGDRERLDMLALLTCADVSAVAQMAWTPAQDTFLRELHGRTVSVLETQTVESEDPALNRKRLLRFLKDHPVPESEIAAFLERLPAHYAVGTLPATIPLHMELVHKAEAGKPGIVWEHDRGRNLSEVTVCAADAPALLSKILGVLYAFDLSIHGLRASTAEPSAEGGQRIALDVCLASFGHQPAPQATCALAGNALEQIVLGRASLEELLQQHGKDPDRMQEHFSFAYVEGSPGILEFQAPRGRGMGYRLAKTISGQGWNIVSARFGQWAGRGAAAFYILGASGRPLAAEEVERALRPHQQSGQG